MVDGFLHTEEVTGSNPVPPTNSNDVQGRWNLAWLSHRSSGICRTFAAMLGDSIATVEKNYLHLSPQYLRGALARLKAA